jgi:hypothetical protein
MAYRCHKNFYRKSKLNLKTPLAYRCHKNFFRKSKLNLKTPLAYRCHRPNGKILETRRNEAKKSQKNY